MTLQVDVSAVIRQIREDKGITVKALSEKIKVTSGHMSQIERGLRPITLDRLELICDLLGVKPSTVIRKAEKK